MKGLAWLLLLAASAVGLALFAGDNPATIAVFWQPYRINLSLNLFVLLLLALFVLFYVALRALQLLFSMPSKAQNWRSQYHERALYQQLIQAMTQQSAGRFSRARKAAELAIAHADNHLGLANKRAAALEKMLAHMLAAESAHQLRDTSARAEHLKLAQEYGADVGEQSEGLSLRAAHWALDDGDAELAWQYLQSLPQGAQRRVHALRLKLKVAQLSGQNESALETARLLSKHNAFAPHVAQSLQSSLIKALISSAQDVDQLQVAWSKLHKTEQDLPEVMHRAARRLLELNRGDEQHNHLVRERLLPLWQDYASLPEHLQQATIDTLEHALGQLDHDWLARIEAAHQRNPRDLRLQYLAGAAYLKNQLWGKAQFVLQQVAQNQQCIQNQPDIARRAWLHLAQLAETQGRAHDAQDAWKRAALLTGTAGRA